MKKSLKLLIFIGIIIGTVGIIFCKNLFTKAKTIKKINTYITVNIFKSPYFSVGFNIFSFITPNSV